MDRTWILTDDRLSREYLSGIETFLGVARNHLNSHSECLCPCRDCANRNYAVLTTIRAHLMRYGFTISYDVWICHGETEQQPSSFLSEPFSTRAESVHQASEIEAGMMEEDDDVLRPLYEDLTRGVTTDENLASGDGNFCGTDNLDRLYPGCKYSTLEAVIRLMHIKVESRWSDKSFNMVLSFIKLMWPDLNNFPNTTYEARNRLRDVGLGYEKIDACKYDCSLFYKEHAKDDRCHVCNESRYKVNDGKGIRVPHKSLRYFRITPRLQRLFHSRHTAKDMRWHKEKRNQSSDVLQHPADGEAWIHLDETYPQFAIDARNVRLGLAADGFCPFSASYSMWPVILVPYNLPPWLCVQQPFRFLSMLIPGPTSPGKDIDVFLRPLIDELKELWNVGVETYDAASNSRFQMRASLLWTINDFPAYGNLSGWSTHGKKACPVCLEDTTSESITSKLSFMGARRDLPIRHSWRRSKVFNGKSENRRPLTFKNGEEILDCLERLPNITFGKHPMNKDHKRKRAPTEHNWTKKSVFFELPYWSKLKIRHILDVMHIEKNILDNILHTLLNTDGKTKDTIKSRIDLEKLNIRPELHLQRLSNGKYVKPSASYVLTTTDRKKFLEFFSSVKFPDGYAANLSRGVNVREGKLYGLKSHDCHVIFQRLLPIAIRPYLPKDLCSAIIEFSYFFKQLTSKSLRKSDLDKMQASIVNVLCKLERIYPPAFFDVMIHLAVHLVREARMAGPVAPRWMYPFERDMGAYKKYVRNRAHPEGSIAEAYTVKEALNFCSMYFDESHTQFSRPVRNDDVGFGRKGTLSVFSLKTKAFGGVLVDEWSKADIDKIHWGVLNNCHELIEFVNEHMSKLEMENPDDLDRRHRLHFPSWFEQRIKCLRSEGSPIATDELYALSHPPGRSVHSYPGCIVNGVRFRIKERDERKKTQNSGVVVLGEHDDDEIDYYGYVTKIIVLKYIFDYEVVVFECTWYDTDPKKKKTKKDYHFHSINIKDTWYRDDPYILAIQARQVFYVDDPKLGRDWKVVQHVEQRQVWDTVEIDEGTTEFSEATLDAYQQNESVMLEFVSDDVDVAPGNELRRIDDLEVTTLTEDELQRLRQGNEDEPNDYDDTFIDDVEEDEIGTDSES